MDQTDQVAGTAAERAGSSPAGTVGRCDHPRHGGPACLPHTGILNRSEERRVGEEGRSWWAPDHLKKKKKIIRVETKLVEISFEKYALQIDCANSVVRLVSIFLVLVVFFGIRCIGIANSWSCCYIVCI